MPAGLCSAGVDAITVSVTIARPREEVFEYLSETANHAEFTDHFLKDWHLTREDSVGRGAGARFRLAAPGNRFPWGDTTFVEVDPPYRIVEVGRGGKYNRIKVTGIYTLSPSPGGATKVEFTSEVEPATLADRIMESFGVRGWLKRKNAKALRRLRAILEEGEERGQRATLAADLPG
jgi:uncharacterized protein YndB with AHSA1/START domain